MPRGVYPRKHDGDPGAQMTDNDGNPIIRNPEDNKMPEAGTGPEWGPLGAIAGQSANQEAKARDFEDGIVEAEPYPPDPAALGVAAAPPIDEKMLLRESYKIVQRYLSSVHPNQWDSGDLVSILDADGLLIDGLRPPKDAKPQERPPEPSTAPMNWNQAGEHLNRAEREAMKTTVAGTPNPDMIRVSGLRKQMNKGPLTRRLYDQIFAVPVPELPKRPGL